MLSLGRFTAPASKCGYLPDQQWRLEYEQIAAITPDEYMQRLSAGWRRFGMMLFRPRCRSCKACRSIRFVVDRLRPNRSQRRVIKHNEGRVRLVIGPPELTPEKLDLYDAYHARQSAVKGWPEHPAQDAFEYQSCFVDNPLETEEWCYYLDGRLVGVGYVDALPAGLSAIYFFYDPAERVRSLGTWNVLQVARQAAQRGVPHVYLGYFVADCPSMNYKSRFHPNETLESDGRWHAFLG